MFFYLKLGVCNRQIVNANALWLLTSFIGVIREDNRIQTLLFGHSIKVKLVVCIDNFPLDKVTTVPPL